MRTQASDRTPAALTRRQLLQQFGNSALALLLSTRPLTTAAAPADAAAVAGVPPLSGRAAAFDLAAVRLLPGPFATAQQLDAAGLLRLEPDRLLHNFRVNAGLAPRAAVYGGWESQQPWIEIRCHGHTLGHYLSACSMMHAATGDAAMNQRVAYIVAELQACQRASGSGLVCAFPDGAAPLIDSLQGKPFPGVPWYTMHKVMAGLRDAHLYTGNRAALEALIAQGDWIAERVSVVDDAQLQTLLDREHGGMNEVLADLHGLTGRTQFLRLAERFCHRALLEPLAAGRDVLDGLHANTQIPKFVGFARLADYSTDPAYRLAAEQFWRLVVGQRSFATGGHGDSEHFFPPAQFADHLQSAKTMETCCTHNMLRLTRALFQRQPAAAYADYYERALYNGILASQDPDSGLTTYFQATRPGYVKLYGTATDSFWCCTGSGMENHARYGDSIYFRADRVLYVNLFIASTLEWRERQLTVTQTTAFPDEALTRLELRTVRPQSLCLRIRQPHWCSGAVITVNGRRRAAVAVNGYVDIDRIWRNGDRVEVRLAMQLHLEPLPGAADYAALMYGPIVLAARLGTLGMRPGADIIVNERSSGEMLNLPMAVPRLALSPDNLQQRVRRIASGALTFAVDARQPKRELQLMPYFRIAHERYNLYWQLES